MTREVVVALPKTARLPENVEVLLVPSTERNPWSVEVPVVDP